MAALPCSSWQHQCLLLVALAVLVTAAADVVPADMHDAIDLVWGQDHTYFFMEDEYRETLAMSLNQSLGSCFKSREMYLYVRIDIQIKLVEGDSAGTVCTLYTTSEGEWSIHDEIDFEFLGNASGQPYTLHTNIFANGQGGREVQFRLWFDATADYHTYTIIWSPKHIIIQVDGRTIRVFDNNEDKGVPFPSWQQQRVYGSLWDAEDWATQGGRIKTDWSQSPFVCYYSNYTVTDLCQTETSPGVDWCNGQHANSTHFNLDQKDLDDLQWTRDNGCVIYDYCTDTARYNATTMPKECSLPRRP